MRIRYTAWFVGNTLDNREMATPASLSTLGAGELIRFSLKSNIKGSSWKHKDLP